MRLKRATYRHIEAEIYAYHDTLHEMNRLRQEIILAGNAEMRPAIGHDTSYWESSTVERRATRLADSLLLREMERITAAIAAVLESMDEEKQKAMEYRYWGEGKGKRPVAVAMTLAVDERTLRRWRNAFVCGIAEKLGWW